MRARSLTPLFLGVLVAGLSSLPAGAEHFEITLSVQTSQGRAESGWDTFPPEGGLNPRQSVTAAAGEEVQVEWRLRSEFPHGVMKKVVIRLYVAPEREAGQKAPPLPGTPRVVDNSFTADFLPHHSARGAFRFRAPAPGAYLVRLQSETTQTEHGHEHFGAVDLVVR